MVIHRTSMPDFPRSNALERLLETDGYQWFMSLDSVMAPLLAPRPDLVELDRGRRVMDFDICHTLGDLERDLDRRHEADRPVFAFSLPQNLHISLRQHGAVPPGEHYPGFFEPYAAEVHRIDACFGEFVAYLKRTGMYDRSIIVLTTDHGDSLGEGGNWGHGVSIHPEVVRIPLIVHIPERMKPLVTTDLTRVSFSTDIVPTLYSLLNHSVRDLGPLFGSPLFVPVGAELTPRRRESFMLASSYGATYGMLRRNGRSLYISDLVNGREYSYDLTAQPIGTRTQVTDDDRRVNQRWIRQRIAELAQVYQFRPEP
jgi:arylsulfatase A-like enzyme